MLPQDPVSRTGHTEPTRDQQLQISNTPLLPPKASGNLGAPFRFFHINLDVSALPNFPSPLALLQLNPALLISSLFPKAALQVNSHLPRHLLCKQVFQENGMTAAKVANPQVKSSGRPSGALQHLPKVQLNNKNLGNAWEMPSSEIPQVEMSPLSVTHVGGSHTNHRVLGHREMPPETTESCPGGHQILP